MSLVYNNIDSISSDILLDVSMIIIVSDVIILLLYNSILSLHSVYSVT